MREIRHIKQLLVDLKGQLAPSQFTEEELIPAYDEDESEKRTFEIEPLGQVYPTVVDEINDKSEFSFFKDSKQRTIQIGFVPGVDSGLVKIIPVHYYAIGIVILKRNTKKLSVWEKPIIETGIVIHENLILEKLKMEQLKANDVNVLDTSGYDSGTSEPINYYTLKIWALQAVKKRKQEIEQEVIERWRQSDVSQSFLVVDGSIINLRGEENIKRCIGLSKSSRIRMSNYDEVMRLREFERSWTFSFQEGESSNLGVRNRISWYLRLRNKSNSDPEFGLVRAELHPSYKSRAKELADRFSKSLVIERLPTAYPETNWDKTLYPIAVCGNYLSSVMPSVRSIRASIKL